MAQAQKPLDNPTPDAPQPPKRGRPPRDPDAPPARARFWERVNKIEENDWQEHGGRAKIKVYRLEPICDRTRIGEGKSICEYLKPVDEEEIKKDNGSGKYRLYLNYQEPGKRLGTELDSLEIHIMDPRCPPVMYQAEWIEHEKNRRWAWAKPFLLPAPTPPPPVPPAPAPSSIGDVVGAFQVFNEMQRTATETIKRDQPPAPAAADANPIVTAMALAKELLTIRAENPMLSVLEKLLTSAQAEAAAQRERADKLLEKLAENNRAEQAARPDAPAMIRTFIDGLKSFRAEAADILPQGKSASRMSPWMEFFQPVLPAVMETLRPLAVSIAQQAMTPNPAPTIKQAPHIPLDSIGGTGGYMPNAPPQQQDLAVFLDLITPRMFHFLRDYNDPAALFAEWLHDGWGNVADQAVNAIISLGGPQALMTWYRTSKYWPAIAPIEQDFSAFLAAVISWKPDPGQPAPEQVPPDADKTDATVIDLDEAPDTGV